MNRRPLRMEALALTIAALIALVAGPAAAQGRKPAPGQEKLAPVPGGPSIVMLPDLVIDSFDGFAGMGCTTGGYTLKFKVTVRNAGSQAAKLPLGWVKVYSNDANKTWPDYAFGEATQLDSGKTATAITNWVSAKSYQLSPYVGDKGVYYTFHAEVDPGNAVKEVSKSNNKKTYKAQRDSPCPGTNP